MTEPTEDQDPIEDEEMDAEADDSEAGDSETEVDEAENSADDDSADDDSADDDSDDDSADDSADDDHEDDDGDYDASDDDAGDDDDDDDEPEAAAAASKRRGGKTRGKGNKKRGMTPGERLAQQKLAKSERKAKAKGRDAEMLEDKALKKADQARNWFAENKNTAIMVAAAAILAFVGVAGFLHYQRSNAEAAAAVLLEGVEASIAPVVAEEDLPEDDDSEVTTYPTDTARQEAALERYDAVLAEHPDSDAAIWARIGRGNSLLALGRAEDAREAFSAAVTSADNDPIVLWRALEGLAFTYEAEENWDEAINRFEELAGESDGYFRPVADYHTARMHLAKGDETRAKELLQAVIASLRGDREDGQPELTFVLSQAEIRLGEIDSSLVQRRTPGFDAPNVIPGGAQGDLTQEQIQELIERLQKSGGGGLPGLADGPE